MSSTDANVTTFLVKLGTLSAGSMTAADVRTKLEAYVPMLRQEFTSAVFCQDALSYVAAQTKFFPAYGELCALLRTWWHDNKPFVPSLPAPTIPDRVPPTEAELAHAHAAMQEAVGNLQRGVKAEAEPIQVKARYLSDGHLLMLWSEQAKAGSPFALARVAHLRQRIEAQAERAA